MLSEDDYKSWLEHTGTKHFLAAMRQKKEVLKEQWAAGKFTDLHEYATSIKNAKAIGQCEEIDWILDMDHNVINAEIEDGEYDRLNSLGQGSAGAAPGNGGDQKHNDRNPANSA